MNCKKCGSRLRVVRTCSGGEGGQVRESECPSCYSTYVVVSFVSHEQGGYGTGASAVAGRLRDGKMKARLEDEKDDGESRGSGRAEG